MTKTVIGLYDDATAAYEKIDDLLRVGIRKDQLSLAVSDETAQKAPVPRAGTDLTGPLGAGHESQRTLVDDLTRIGVPQNEAEAYAEGVRRGGALLAIHADDQAADRATEIMQHPSVIDLEDRTARWQESGWAGYQPGAAPYTAEEAARERQTYATAPAARGTEEKIPVVEEDVHVGKREVPRGRVRVHSHVVETPVEETVRLRDEEAHVERHATDRPVRPGDEAFRDRTVEVTETDEEAMVNKEARVVEEVAVSKEAKEREETVRDTVRRTEVDVEDTTGKVKPKR